MTDKKVRKKKKELKLWVFVGGIKMGSANVDDLISNKKIVGIGDWVDLYITESDEIPSPLINRRENRG